MKKSTLEAIHNYLNGDDTVDLSVLRDEVNAEWERTTAKSRANAEIYNAAHDIAITTLSQHPNVTVKELYEYAKSWPDGMTAAKVQYALLHYWNDEVVKESNGKAACTYHLKK